MKNFKKFSKSKLNSKQLKKIIGGTDTVVSDPKSKDDVIVPPRGN